MDQIFARSFITELEKQGFAFLAPLIGEAAAAAVPAALAEGAASTVGAIGVSKLIDKMKKPKKQQPVA